MTYCKYGVTILAGLTLAACGGSDEGRGTAMSAPTTVATLTTAQLDAATASSGLQALTGKAKCNVTVAQINYRTPSATSPDMSNASGAVLIPSGANCSGPFPLIAYAKGTDVQKPRTLANPQDGETFALMAFYAAQGYAVVATDYLGYAQSAFPYHPYLHADSEASTVIDSIRATRNLASALGLSLSGKVMLTGYSQGGHSSMAAQRAMERDNASEFNLVGAAHLAGPYNMSGSIVAGVANPIAGTQFFTPFAITSWQKVYGNLYANASDIFNAPYASYIETLMPSPTLTYTTLLTTGKLPADAPAVALGKLFKSSYLNDVATNPNNATLAAAKKQDLLGWNPKAPVTLCGGSGDPTVGYNLHAVTAFNDFKSRGLTNVTKVDVDPAIQQVYGSVLTADPATYYGSYHGTYEPPFCHQVAKAMFDQVSK